MTVPSQTNRISFAGNGSTVAFTIPASMWFLEDADIKVVQVVDATAVETVKVLVTDYSLTGAGSQAGGTLTMVVAPPTGTTLWIIRDPVATQGYDPGPNDAFPAESQETAFDRLTMLVLRLKERAGKALLLAETSTTANLLLPEPVSGWLVRWRTDLLGLENVDPTTVLPGSATLPLALNQGGTGQTTQPLAFGAIVAPGGAFTGRYIDKHGADIAAAATLALDNATGNIIDVTGNTTITAITLADGAEVVVRFTGTPLLTNGASLVLPGGANIQAAAGDFAVFRGYASSVVRCTGYVKASGAAVSSSIGKHMIPIPAANWMPRTTTGCAALAQAETATNRVNYKHLGFDGTAIEYAQFAMPMPSSWNEGTLSARFIGIAASGSGDVIMGIQAQALSDNDTVDTAFGTAVEVTDTCPNATTIRRSAETAAFTVGGTPAAGDWVVFQIYRKATDANDTLNGIDFNLIAVELFMTTDAQVDS